MKTFKILFFLFFIFSFSSFALEDEENDSAFFDFKANLSIIEAIQKAQSRYPDLYPVKVELVWYTKGPVWKVFLKNFDTMWKEIKINANTGEMITKKKVKSKPCPKINVKNKELYGKKAPEEKEKIITKKSKKKLD